MHKSQHVLLGNGPYPYRPGSDEFSSHIAFFASENFSIVASRFPIDMKPESHEHDSYEFTIPLSHSPLLKVDNNEIIVPRNTLTSCNPGQVHGPACNLKGAHFMALQLNREFIENISEEMSGKRYVAFDNKPVIVPANLFNQTKEYMTESSLKQNGYKFLIETLSIQIAVNLLRNVTNNTLRHKEYSSLSYSKNIKRAVEYINEYYTGKFSIDDISREANLSKFHFIRVFKSETGKTPYEYMMELKMQQAKQLLKKRQYTITEVCFLLGFSDHSHFTKMFKKKTGYTPTEFIDQMS